MNDREAVVAANRAFYDAFESLEIGKMESQRRYEGISRSQVLTTNVFERCGERWLMVVHHGSPIVQPEDDEPPLQ